MTSLEQTQSALAAIHKDNPRLNAFITVMEESALADARRADGQRDLVSLADRIGVPAETCIPIIVTLLQEHLLERVD